MISTGVLWAVSLMTLFNMDDPFGLKAVMLLLALLFSDMKTYRKPSHMDLAVGAVWIYGIIRCFSGINPLQGMQSALDTTTLLLFYMLLRTLDNEHTVIYLKGLCTLIGIALFLSLSSFFIFNRAVNAAGFPDTYHLRFLFRPLGYISNAWTTVLMAAWGIILFTLQQSTSAHWNRWLFIIGTVGLTGILLSFSRGAYVCMALWLPALFLTAGFRKNKSALLAMTAVAVTVCSCLFPKETLTTLRMHETVSQQQSTEGRIRATQKAADVFKQHPWFGTGTGTYTLAVDKTLFQDSTAPYTSYAPNAPLQWGIEKGTIGWLLYGLLGAVLCHTLWKRRREPAVLLAGSTLGILAIKELSLSTVSPTPPAALLCCTLLALLSSNSSQKPQTTRWFLQPKYKFGVLSGVLLVSIAFFIWHRQEERNNNVCLEKMKKGEYAKALQELEKNGHAVPYLINRFILYMKLYEQEKDNTLLEKAETTWKLLKQKAPEDIAVECLKIELDLLNGKAQEAEKHLKSLTTDYPDNAFFHERLYHHLYTSGLKKEALAELNTAIRLYPRLLTLPDLKNSITNDTVFYNTLKKQLLSQHPTFNAPPGELARYGYIAYHLNDKTNAEKYLLKSVESMPSLSTPWFLLSLIYDEQDNAKKANECLKKHTLLANGAFVPQGWERTDTKTELPAKYELSKHYLYKFQLWYGSQCVLSSSYPEH